MLESFSSLGGDGPEDFVPVDNPSIKNIAYMLFERKQEKVFYVSCDMEEYSKKDSQLYLYKRDYSGKPGLFLCGKIDYKDIKKIIDHKESLDHPDVAQFVKKKILWIKKNKLVKNEKLYNQLDSKHRKILENIFEQIDKKKDQIIKDFIKLFTNYEPQTILFTVKIKQGNTEKFPGKFKAFRDFFYSGVMDKKISSPVPIVCHMCGDTKECAVYRETPIPFYITDKPTFFPNADGANAINGFSTCDDCCIKIRKGIEYIKKHLTYRLPSTEKFDGKLNFWLIPHLYDVETISEFSQHLKSKSLIVALRELVETLKEIEVEDKLNHDPDLIRFSCLFFIVDDRGIMRVLNHIHGLNPLHLEKLVEIQKKIHSSGTLITLRKTFDKKLFFGFPIIVDIYADNVPQWKTQVIYLLERIFCAKSVDLDQIYELINKRSKALNYDLKSISRNVTLGLLLVEYLISLNSLVKERNVN